MTSHEPFDKTLEALGATAAVCLCARPVRLDFAHFSSIAQGRDGEIRSWSGKFWRIILRRRHLESCIRSHTLAVQQRAACCVGSNP
jgi:hypothetical protein